jgi:hypothetical protein
MSFCNSVTNMHVVRPSSEKIRDKCVRNANGHLMQITNVHCLK